MGEGNKDLSFFIHPPIYSSIHVYPSIHPSTYLFIHLFIHPSTHACIHPFISSIHPSTHLPTHLSIHPPTCSSLYPSIYPPFQSSIHSSIYPYIYPSTTHPSIHLSIFFICLLIQKDNIESLPHVRGTSLDSSLILLFLKLHCTGLPPPARALSTLPLSFILLHDTYLCQTHCKFHC